MSSYEAHNSTVVVQGYGNVVYVGEKPRKGTVLMHTIDRLCYNSTCVYFMYFTDPKRKRLLKNTNAKRVKEVKGLLFYVE